MDILKNFREKINLTNIKDQVTNARYTAQMIEGMLSLLQDNKIPASVKEMINNLKVVVIDQPNIISINHFINHFLLKINPESLPIVLKELLEVFHERWKNVDRKTAQVAFNLYNFKNKRIAFFGNSDYMLALIDICNVHESHPQVIQILGNTDKEGKEQAKEILLKDIEVKVADLNNVGKLHNEIDFIILNSDIIMHEKFMAKTGTNLLVSWAYRYQIPVLVLSDSRKILNTKILPSSVLDSFTKVAPKNTSEIWKSAPDGIEIINYPLEEVENSYIDFFILEQQAYPPSDLSQEVDKILISKLV